MSNPDCQGVSDQAQAEIWGILTLGREANIGVNISDPDELRRRLRGLAPEIDRGPAFILWVDQEQAQLAPEIDREAASMDKRSSYRGQ